MNKSIEELMQELCGYLPDDAIHEACLTLLKDGTWSVMVGGHSAVHIGEWGGDYIGYGYTPEQAIQDCLKAMSR